MNNLTIGTPKGALYETIGGGRATPTAPGADAVQIHMTNTPATDVEELEARFPLRLESWCIRRGSGGDGQHVGGDGVEKTWHLAPADVSILAGRRTGGAMGLQGVVLGAPVKMTGSDRGVGSPLRRSFGQSRVTVFVFEHRVVAGMDG